MNSEKDRSTVVAVPAAPCVPTAGRTLALPDLALLNRMTTLGQVLPSIAHDVNNALQVISGLVEMLMLRGELSAEASDRVTRIATQSARATGLMRELVAFSRREGAGVRLVDINRLVEHALQFRRYYLSRARIDVSVVPLDPPSLVRADGSDLLQIMLNLLINAEQAVQGQPSARIELLATRAGHDIELIVSDNGPGLEADLESVTARPFFTTKSGAAGLGLTIAATLTRLNGGTLRLERGNHGGAVAVVTFPTAT